MSVATLSATPSAAVALLGNVAELVMGQAPPGSDCNKDGKGTVFVKAGEFDDRFPIVCEWTTRPLKLAKSGDVLVCVVGATAGKINQAINCAIGRSVAAVRPSSKLVTEYLYHFLATKVAYLRAKSQGLAQGVITREMLNELPIPLPPLAEQRRIAEVLDRAEALRAKRRAALAQLDSLTQSLFLDLFGDPATNPKGWPVQQLQEVVKKGSIVTYGIVQAGEEFQGGVPYIRTGDIVDGEIVAAGLRHTDPAIAAKFRRSRVEAGDIVMSIRATVGTTALVPPQLDGANLTQGTGKISPGEKTDRLYLLNYLRTPGTQHWISLQIKGATFREITLTRLRELPVAVPPISLQREFARRVTAVERLKTAHRTSLAELDALFASLQHRAFKGEL